MSDCVVVWTTLGKLWRNWPPEAVDRRFKLFLLTALPSLRRQSRPVDYVIIVTDDATKQRYEAMPDLCQQAGIIWVSREAVSEWFNSLPPQFDRLTTLRIDSDDMYAPTAIELAAEKPPGFWLFKVGYYWDIPRDAVWKWSHPSPPFFAQTCYREDDGTFAVRRPQHRRVQRIAKGTLPPWQYAVTWHNERRGSSSGALRRYCSKLQNGKALFYDTFTPRQPVWDSDKHPAVVACLGDYKL